ncbi:MAG TPA: MltR family transcriptional regulator [Pyrinomonadaceae bacterium]|nr:MltR family transcriptional regulator [Pyrinomonadaceae bacterium]
MFLQLEADRRRSSRPSLCRCLLSFKTRMVKRKQSDAEALMKSKDFQGFLEEFQKENDRSTAIIGAAFLDEHLKQLLTNFFVADAKEVAHLLSTESPLGSFGARIRAVYCLGLISREYFESLKIIKGIRNDFAHQLHGLTFDDKNISNECKKLKPLQPIKSIVTQTPRQLFVTSTIFVLMDLSVRTFTILNKRRRTPNAPAVQEHFV